MSRVPERHAGEGGLMGPEVGCGDEAGPLTAVHIHLPVREGGGQPIVVYSWKEKFNIFIFF